MASYKGVVTPKELCLKNVRTSDQLYAPKVVTNAPKLPTSKSLTNVRSKVRETLLLFQVVGRKSLHNQGAQVKDRTVFNGIHCKNAFSLFATRNVLNAKTFTNWIFVKSPTVIKGIHCTNVFSLFARCQYCCTS